MKTAFFEIHKNLGGKFVDYFGWELPVQYSGVIDEHLACRKAAGLFDVSHMGEFTLEGKDATAFLNFAITNNVQKAGNGRAVYSPLCHPSGGVVDDLIAYKFSENKYLLVVNAANTLKDFDYLSKIEFDGDYELKNVSSTYSQIALQGPKAESILQKLVTVDLSKISRHSFIETDVDSILSIVARTGYTGEDGFEIYSAWDSGPQLWNRIYEVGRPLGLKPCGLGARDTLRLEARLPLYGNELLDDINPIEAGLKWTVDFTKPRFVGKEPLQSVFAAGPKRKLVGLVCTDRGIPRKGYKLMDQSGTQVIGEITSGTQSPTLEAPIGLGYVEASYATEGLAVFVDIRGKNIAARVQTSPFYRRAP